MLSKKQNYIIYLFITFSNIQELRKQLENQVVTIDTLRNEKREVTECCENVWVGYVLLYFFCH